LHQLYRPKDDGRSYDSDDDILLDGLAPHALCPALYLAGGVVLQMRGLGAHTGSFYPLHGRLRDGHRGISPFFLSLASRLRALIVRTINNQVDEIRAKLSDLDHQIAQNTGNRDAVKSTIAKLTDSIPYLRKRADARKYLLDKGYGSKLDYLTIEQDLIEHQQELQVQKGRLAEAEGAIEAHKQQRRQAEDEYKHNTLKDLAEAEQKSTSLHDQLLQAAQKYRLQTLTAPVYGTVQQLAVHTEGGVVTPAQVLMSIVPADSHLEIEAMVSNKDIGFVHAGEDAEVKIDTFTFTRYGLIHGKVQSVSQDAIVREKPQEKPDDKRHTGDESDSSEPAGQELVYSARVSLDKTQMQIDDRLVNLGPGMAVTVEIKTGSRHIIEYLLSPLLRHKHQAMREQ
jgi:hemolysin D